MHRPRCKMSQTVFCFNISGREQNMQLNIILYRESPLHQNHRKAKRTQFSQQESWRRAGERGNTATERQAWLAKRCTARSRSPTGTEGLLEEQRPCPGRDPRLLHSAVRKERVWGFFKPAIHVLRLTWAEKPPGPLCTHREAKAALGFLQGQSTEMALSWQHLPLEGERGLRRLA